MEHKYIDADVLKEKVIDLIAKYAGDTREFLFIFEDLIKEMPAADVEPMRRWIPCSEQLPKNAKDPDAFRPRYQIHTSYGITEGWYGWSKETSGWYALIWFMDGRYEEWNIDFKRGDVSKVVFIPDGGKVKVYAWREFPEPPKMDGGSEE